MDFSELKKAIAQAQDRFKQQEQGQMGPQLPEATPEELSVASDSSGYAMGSLGVKAPLKEPMAAEQLAEAFERQKLQREFEQAKNTARAMSKRTGQAYVEPPFPVTKANPKVDPDAAIQETLGGIDLAQHIENNPDIAPALKQVMSRPEGRAKLNELAGPDGRFQAIRNLLSKKQ
jgi:hypothetical protein